MHTKLERPRPRRVDILATTAVAAAAVILAAVGGGYASHASAAPADVTVLPCSAFADTSTPDLPPNTFGGACSEPDGTLSVPGELPAIPRCAEDDWNADHVDRCWTETVDGVVLVLDQDDRVVSGSGE